MPISSLIFSISLRSAAFFSETEEKLESAILSRRDISSSTFSMAFSIQLNSWAVSFLAPAPDPDLPPDVLVDAWPIFNVEVCAALLALAIISAYTDS